MSINYQKVTSTKGHKKYSWNIEKYESAMNVAEDCSKRRITNDSFKDMAKERMGSFEGVRSYEEALDLLKNGYQPTVENLREKLKATCTGTGKRIKFQNDICGFAPVVPLAMKGIPQAMIGMTMRPIKTKVIDIYYDITCSCGTSSEQIIENGQKLLGAVIALEKAGYRFNIYAVQSYTESRNADMLIVKVKSSDKPIDLKRISFPLTHTAFFRVIGFDWYSKTPKGTYRGGYGHAISFEFDSSDEQRELAEQLFGSNAIFILGREIMHKNEEYIMEVLTNGKN